MKYIVDALRELWVPVLMFILLAIAALNQGCSTMTEYEVQDRRNQTIQKYWLCRKAYERAGKAWVRIDPQSNNRVYYTDMRRELMANSCRFPKA